ncbi:MAG: DUF4258 domain-containing protein [Sulfurimonas sp.]
MNKVINWNEEKNQLLQLQRGISFEMVLEKLLNGDILGRKSHPNIDKYPNQKIFILEIDSYICYVPFVENEAEIFLKTIIPSRKLNKKYKGDYDEQ